ncbi:hypothetical protein IEQ44_15415 [Nocardioides sp. Y6]|uniref:FtsX-like permease family protein n=1 Tax=Nocardioides malaquae TaxID=2773426 RepID=A0ABR9RWS2_9ACTN|nr:hypothetical protein [Nocardioides malaquae]MBE7326035.1 hypothetical protein [Nocardioides malaquae]
MLTASLVRRLLWRLRLRWAAAPLFVVVAFAFGGNVFLDEQTLTAEQQAQLLPGRFDASASLLSLSVPVGKPYLTGIQELFDVEGLPVTMSLQVIDFPAYSLADDGLYFREIDWTADPFPGVYTVIEGRMPRNPGEVAVVGDHSNLDAAVGDKVPTLGQPDTIEVVGLVQSTLEDNSELLAAPGTLARLHPGRSGLDSNLTSSPTFFVDGRVDAELSTTIAQLLHRYDPQVFSLPAPAMADAIDAAVRTRADARADVEKPWTERSSLLFYLPVLTLVPLGVLLCLHGLRRQLGPALRVMAMQGVRRRTIFAVGFFTTTATALTGALVGSGVGALAGHLAAQVDDWSAPAATWRFPLAAVLATGSGLLAGVAACAALFAGAHRARPLRHLSAPGWLRHLRHGLATIAAAYAITLLPRLDTAGEALTLTVVVTLVATLLAPDALAWLIAHVRSSRLVMRLTTRSMRGSAARHATTAMALTLSVAVCAGVLAATATALEAERRQRGSTALPGQVALDNDGTPFLPVDHAVIRAAETVPSMAGQEPVQLYFLGRHVTVPDYDIIDLSGALTTGGSGLVIAFETVEDVERATGRDLTELERGTLKDAGVLVIDPSVSAASGRVDLIDEKTGQVAAAGVKALDAEFEPTPWLVAISSIMLVETATSVGHPVAAGARIYTDIPDRDAEAVLKALSDRGISPEQAETYRIPPDLVPPAALSGLSAALFLVVLLLAIAAVRGQVAMMRPWASRLTQLGVRGSWAKSAIRRQFVIVAGTALPLGLLAGLGPLLISRMLIPSIAIVVPWDAVGALMASLAVAMMAAAWISTRTLTAQESVGWLDLDGG